MITLLALVTQRSFISMVALALAVALHTLVAIAERAAIGAGLALWTPVLDDALTARGNRVALTVRRRSLDTLRIGTTVHLGTRVDFCGDTSGLFGGFYRWRRRRLLRGLRRRLARRLRSGLARRRLQRRCLRRRKCHPNAAARPRPPLGTLALITLAGLLTLAVCHADSGFVVNMPSARPTD